MAERVVLPIMKAVCYFSLWKTQKITHQKEAFGFTFPIGEVLYYSTESSAATMGDGICVTSCPFLLAPFMALYHKVL